MVRSGCLVVVAIAVELCVSADVAPPGESALGSHRARLRLRIFHTGYGDRGLDVGRQRTVGLPGCQRAHEDPVGNQGVHSDSVTEQCAARPSLGGVDRQHGQLLFRIVSEETKHQLVGEG